MPRLSWTQVNYLLTCPTKFDYAYGSKRLGYRLEPKVAADRVTMGSVWGRAMAVYHANGREAGLAEFDHSIREIAGVLNLTEEGAQLVADTRLAFREYALLDKPLGTKNPEGEYERQIPGCPDWTFRSKIDGYYVRTWPRVVDYKLRTTDNFMDAYAAARSLQARLYAWSMRPVMPDIGLAYHESHARHVTDEVKLNKDGRPSKNQSCALSTYVRWHAQRGLTPVPEVVEKLRGRGAVAWKLTEVDLYDDEDEQITELLQGVVAHLTLWRIPAYHPPRAIASVHCKFCQFAEICDHPLESEDRLVSLFHKKEAKWTPSSTSS